MGLVTISILKKRRRRKGSTNPVFSSFSCPMNVEITDFLARSVIPFAQKNMAITHFVFDEDSFAMHRLPMLIERRAHDS